jgi:hypothetical protein
MIATGSISKADKTEEPPLTIPPDVWAQVSPDEKVVLRRAQHILDHLVVRETIKLPDLREVTGLDVEDLLTGLRALVGMHLVEFDNEGRDLVAKLIAVPDEHVRVIGPDEKPRWLFVARPLSPPDVDPSQLN